MSVGQGKLVMFSHAMGLSEEDTAQFHTAVADLSGLLRAPPVGLDMQVEKLPSDCVEDLEATVRDAKQFDDVYDSVAGLLRDRFGDVRKVLVACRPDHEFARGIKQKRPAAAWGVAFVGGPFGVIYNLSNKYLVWHEALHLLGADDCYDQSNQGPTCEHTSCIMQYVPTAQTVGEWPFLCTENVGNIRSLNQQFLLSPDEEPA